MTSPAPTARRLLLLAPGAARNGVDFAVAERDRIEVHFINRVRIRGTLARNRAPVTLTCQDMLPELIVHPIDDRTAWSTDTSGRPVLHLTADRPAVFARYLLTVHSDRLDPAFRHTTVSVGGPPTGCAGHVGAANGLADGEPAVAINYLAKDFQSFVASLSDFSAAHYPHWTERSEADLGVMLMEALSAFADELSYQQDRVAAEATIGTATQPLSLLRHARLVDYEPDPAMAAATVLQLDVATTFSGTVGCQAVDDDGQLVEFTAGTEFPGLALSGSGLDPRWNRYTNATKKVPALPPYLWDHSRPWLRRGETSMWISGHALGFYPGQLLLLDTNGEASGDPPVREIVQLTEWAQDTDPVGQNEVTLIRWATGLQYDHDLNRTVIAGNILPVVQGTIVTEEFTIPGASASAGEGQQDMTVATVRSASCGSQAQYLYSLTGPLSWQPVPARDGGPAGQQPAISLSSRGNAGQQWAWARRLLDADGGALAFTITPEQYSPVNTGTDLDFADYDGDGTTIRFGDGTFGRLPAPGTVFTARYLSGGGTWGNVNADTIVTVAPRQAEQLPVFRQAEQLPVLRCTNPFPATGGANEEAAASIRSRAPRRFRDGLLSLTVPADYESAVLAFAPGPDAENGDAGHGVLWARSAFRWTGSWLSALTLVDPGADEPAGALAELAGLLDVRRLAGSESSVRIARYLWLDLHVVVRAKPGRHRSDVEAAVLDALTPRPRADGTTGFFGRDKWPFGRPLEASALVAAVQACAGVTSVTRIEYRHRAAAARWHPLPGTIRVRSGQILRIDNDPNRPDRGLLSVTAQVTP